MKEVFRKTLYLLKLLAKENNAVQTHIFDRLDVLLDVRVAESDLAIALKEVSLKFLVWFVLKHIIFSLIKQKIN